MTNCPHPTQLWISIASFRMQIHVKYRTMLHNTDWIVYGRYCAGQRIVSVSAIGLKPLPLKSRGAKTKVANPIRFWSSTTLARKKGFFSRFYFISVVAIAVLLLSLCAMCRDRNVFSASL